MTVARPEAGCQNHAEARMGYTHYWEPRAFTPEEWTCVTAAARRGQELAVEAVKRDAGECLVRAMYAPNVPALRDVQVETSRARDVLIVRSRLLLAGIAGIEPDRGPEVGWG